MRMIDITGERFGKLTVIVRDGSAGNKAVWRCRCDCGNETRVVGTDLRTGNTKSCGCLKSDTLSSGREKGSQKAKETNIRHGGAKGKAHERLYEVWRDMKQRTSNPNAPHFRRYGGRGITVCDEWRNSYASFREWAYANGYDETAPRGQCTLDRINNENGYSPDNCRWVDSVIQASNRRRRGRRDCGETFA